MMPYIQSGQSLPLPAGNPLRQQAEQLEGVFLNTLVKEMFSSIDTDGAFGGGFGEETWRGIQAEEMANAMARAGGIGLADQLVADLMRLQEATQTKIPATLPTGASQ